DGAYAQKPVVFVAVFGGGGGRQTIASPSAVQRVPSAHSLSSVHGCAHVSSPSAAGSARQRLERHSLASVHALPGLSSRGSGSPSSQGSASASSKPARIMSLNGETFV